MAAAEGAAPILQRGKVSAGRHLVVDRRSGVKRDLKHGPRIRDVTPPPPAADGSCIGPNKRSAAVEFRVTMEALAEEERVAGAVLDVSNANAAADPEDAVPGHARKDRRTARMDRALAGVAAITAQPIETPGPRGTSGSFCREFPYGFR